jgi:hypothetical protein
MMQGWIARPLKFSAIGDLELNLEHELDEFGYSFEQDELKED